MVLFFNGVKLAKNADTLSGGVNLLVNTDQMTQFNNLGNKGDSIGYSIDDKARYADDLNAKEIKTNVFHAFGSTLKKSASCIGSRRLFASWYLDIKLFWT